LRPVALRRAKRSMRYAVCLASEIPVSAHRAQRRVSRGDRRILFVAQNRLMAEYVVRVWGTVSAHSGIEGWFLGDRADLPADLKGGSELRTTTYGRAAVTSWDAIVLADHAPLTFAPSIPRVAVSHGLARSRHVGQGSYYYDRSRLFWPDGRPVYTMMFSTSDASREWAIARVPEYSDRIRVVGDLRVDEMLASASRSAICREELGLPRDRTVVLMMSTWGPHGLLPRIGRDLLAQIKRPAFAGYHFVLTMHPNLWSGPRSHTQLRDAVLDAEGGNLTVIRPEDDWAPYLASSDVCVTDHTSLAATFAILERPIVAFDVEDGVVGDDTFAALVLRHQPRLGAANELEFRLAVAVSQQGLAPPVADAARRLVSHRHEAADMTRASLWSLVGEPHGC